MVILGGADGGGPEARNPPGGLHKPAVMELLKMKKGKTRWVSELMSVAAYHMTNGEILPPKLSLRRRRR